ncbi:MAG: hypothetical protein WA123_09535 [Methylotenera sp.]
MTTPSWLASRFGSITLFLTPVMAISYNSGLGVKSPFNLHLL